MVVVGPIRRGGRGDDALLDRVVPSLSVKFPRGVVWYWVLGIGY